MNRRFRFLDEGLQSALLALVRAGGVPHTVDADGAICYAVADEEVVGNEFICSIREWVFPEWSIFTLEGCEMRRPLLTARYRAFMTQHGIPFVEELHDGFSWFLVPGDQDSFEWIVSDDDSDETE